MATFTPPLADNGSLADGCAPGSRGERLWRYYDQQPRGVNVLEYDNGTFQMTDAYPFIIDGVGRTVVRAYKGGIAYTVTASQAAAITAAGLGAYLS